MRNSVGLTEVSGAYDYFAFGMMMPGRKVNNGYRYGFNGKEKEEEMLPGDYDFGARIYASRLGRWWSVDRYSAKYPSHSSYNFAINNPIFYIDPDGNDKTTYYTVIADQGTATFEVVTKNDVEFGYSEYFDGTFKFVAYDLEQNITLDLRTNISPGEDQTSYGEVTRGGIIDFSKGVKQRGSSIAGKADSYFPEGKGGGFAFVADDAATTGTKQKATGMGGSRMRDIGDLLTALGATKFGSTALPNIRNVEEVVNTLTGLYGAEKDRMEQRAKEQGEKQREGYVTCEFCNHDTIPASEKGQHSGPFKEVEIKEEKK